MRARGRILVIVLGGSCYHMKSSSGPAHFGRTRTRFALDKNMSSFTYAKFNSLANVAIQQCNDMMIRQVVRGRREEGATQLSLVCALALQRYLIFHSSPVTMTLRFPVDGSILRSPDRKAWLRPVSAVQLVASSFALGTQDGHVPASHAAGNTIGISVDNATAAHSARAILI